MQMGWSSLNQHLCNDLRVITSPGCYCGHSVEDQMLLQSQCMTTKLYIYVNNIMQLSMGLFSIILDVHNVYFILVYMLSVIQNIYFQKVYLVCIDKKDIILFDSLSRTFFIISQLSRSLAIAAVFARSPTTACLLNVMLDTRHCAYIVITSACG